MEYTILENITTMGTWLSDYNWTGCLGMVNHRVSRFDNNLAHCRNPFYKGNACAFRYRTIDRQVPIKSKKRSGRRKRNTSQTSAEKLFKRPLANPFLPFFFFFSLLREKYLYFEEWLLGVFLAPHSESLCTLFFVHSFGGQSWRRGRRCVFCILKITGL